MGDPGGNIPTHLIDAVIGFLAALVPIIPALYKTYKGQRALLDKLEAQAELLRRQGNETQTKADIGSVEAARHAIGLLVNSYQTVEERLKNYNEAVDLVERMQDERQQDKEEIAALRVQVAELTARLSAESGRVAQLTAEVEQAINARRAELQKARREAGQLRSQVKELQRRVSTLEEENAEAMERIASLEEINRVLSAENATLRKPASE